MMLKFNISCGDLNLHWDWSPFELVSIAPKLAQVACSWICSACMSSPLDFNFGLAISFALARVLKTSIHFFHHQIGGMQFMVLFNSQKWPTFLLLQKCSNQFWKLRNIARIIYIFFMY